MELKHLHYFLSIAETLNFSRASEQLYISQPALSHQISMLEDELGVELFTRDRRRVILTPAGQALIQPAQELLRQSEQLPQIVQNPLADSGGLLRVGFDDTEDHFELIGVTPTLAAFTAQYPDAKLQMNKLPFTDCTDKLVYDDLDVAFLILRHKEKLSADLISRSVYRSRIVMVIAKHSPAQTPEDAIRLHELILVDAKPRGNSRILSILDGMKLTPRIHKVDSMTSGFVYVQAGTGIMLMSEIYFLQHRYPFLRSLPIDSNAAYITHEIVCNRGTKNPLVQELINMFPKIE